MPRPRKTQHTRKSRVIAFRITTAEFEKLADAAERAGMGINQIARIAALANAERIVVKVYAASDPALLARLHRIGHNLNQLVKNAHIFGRVSPKVDTLCDLIQEIINEAASEEWDR